MEAFIIGAKTTLIRHADLLHLLDLFAPPQFIRFDRVWLYYRSCQCSNSTSSITEKCQSFVDFLRPLKKTINCPNLINFSADINGCYGNFVDPNSLICHLRNELLIVFDSPRRYQFSIHFYQDIEAMTNVIAQILQMPQVFQCANVEFYFNSNNSFSRNLSLPVAAISKFLNRKSKSDRMGRNSLIQKETYLRVDMYRVGNASEMCDQLKKVLLFSDI